MRDAYGGVTVLNNAWGVTVSRNHLPECCYSQSQGKSWPLLVLQSYVMPGLLRQTILISIDVSLKCQAHSQLSIELLILAF